MKPALGKKKGRPLALAVCRVGPERKTLGSGLNAGNIGAEIDVIKPALPAQTHAPIAIHFALGVSRTYNGSAALVAGIGAAAASVILAKP
jgi:hypothetical protein